MLRVLLVRVSNKGSGSFSSVLLYTLQEQGLFLHSATIAVALTENRNYVLSGSVQVSEAPPSEDMAAIFPRTYGIAYIYVQFL